MKWLLAMDGGGTKTVACAVDLTGTIIGKTESGPSNYQVIGPQKLVALVEAIINHFVSTYNLEKMNLELISLGLAGVDRAADRDSVTGLLRRTLPDRQLIINNDAAIALAAETNEDDGIVLIAGTGSIAYGINSDGEVIRAGGWGHILGDEGSGYAIGLAGLRRGLKAMEGRDKESVLLVNIMTYLNVDELAGLVRFIYSADNNKKIIASLAKVVAKAAAEGDSVAGEILAEAAFNLAKLVESVRARGIFADKMVKVYTFGGILNNIPVVRQILAEKLAEKAILIRPENEPVTGAIKLGLKYLKR